MTHIICDLDGVLWRGRTAIPGAASALARAASQRADLTFATNNSTKSPEDVVRKIEHVLGFAAAVESVVTSSMAAASMLTRDDGPVFVVGEEGVFGALDKAGLESTEHAHEAKAVIVGLDRDFRYDKLSQASSAVRNGARFVATNLDPTYPSERGLEPGSGSVVKAVIEASGQNPEVAGKPSRAMANLIASRRPGPAWVIGDRLDTDIALAANSGQWRSVLVLTGVTDEHAPGVGEADHVVADISEAIDLVLADVVQS